MNEFVAFVFRRTKFQFFIALMAAFAMAMCNSSKADSLSPPWPSDATHRLLVQVDAIDIGNRPREGMVASVHVDFTQYRSASVDLSSLMIRQYDPATGKIIDNKNNAFARITGDLPMEFYDDQIPYQFPKFQGYANPITGVVSEPIVMPGAGRLFDIIGSGKSGAIAWAHMQNRKQTSHYEISFKDLPPGAPQRPPPAGFLGDGINRCTPGGNLSPIISGHLGVGDLRGTGLADIVLGNSTGNVLWYPNHGTPQDPRYDTGTLLCTEDGKPIDIGWSSTPDVVDWDGDGLPDLLVGAEKEVVFFFKNVGDRHHPVFRNMGLLKLADGTTLHIPHSPCEVDPQNKMYRVDNEPVPHAVDWKGSGKLDLLLGGYITGRIFYYENVAASPKDLPKLVYRGPLQADGKDLCVGWCAAPCTGDFRHVGKLDLITGSIQMNAGGGDEADRDKFLIYYENIGPRQNPVLHRVPFPASAAFPIGECAAPRAVDLFHNGLLDLIVCANTTIYVFPNIGSPTKPRFDTTAKPLAAAWGNSPLPGGEPTFIDFNSDGCPDMFVMDQILINSGRGFPGIFDKVVPLPGAEKIYHPTLEGDHWDFRSFADIDGDGNPDILVADNEGHIWFHRNIGTANAPAFDSVGQRLICTDGKLVKAGILPSDSGETEAGVLFDKLQGARCHIAVLHVDHTPFADLALSDTYGQIRLFMHDPTMKKGQTPRFLPPISLPEPYPHARLTVKRVDWNHDGWDDLLYAYGDSEYFVLLNEPGPNGSRHYAPPQRLNVPPGFLEPFVSVVDWNNDGDNDLLVEQTGQTRLFEQSFIEHGYIPGHILSAQSL